jgi:hypothetical protein
VGVLAWRAWLRPSSCRVQAQQLIRRAAEARRHASHASLGSTGHNPQAP